MTAGVFPAPTPIAGLPEEYAALTIPGPPVARMMSASFISRLVISRLGASIQSMTPLGAPAASAASRMMRAASAVQFFARGCGLMIIALRVFSAIRHLKIAVEVGFVVGMTAATTPSGSAMRVIPKAGSRSITPQVRVSLYAL